MRSKTVPVLLLFLVMVLSGCTPSDPAEPTIAVTIPTVPVSEPVETTVPSQPNPFAIGSGDHRMRYDSEAFQDYLEYYLHIPEKAEEGMPLIIFLHGDGQVDHMDGLSSYGMMHEAQEIYGDQFPFLAITPCTRVISWVNDPIPDVLMELIGCVADTYCIDKSKIIITGHSRGAIGTWNLISLYGDYFSAAVPVSCDCGDRIINYDKAAEVPVRAFVGNLGDLDEKYISPMTYMCYEITRHGGDAELTILWDHYHNATCEDAFTPELFEWMLAQ